MCTSVPGLGAGKCNGGKVPKVTCPNGLDRCMSLKGKMTILGFTQNIELKNCSNNVLCDSASDYNGRNSKEFRPSPPPIPPLPPTLWRRLPYESYKDAGSIFVAYKFRFSSWLERCGGKKKVTKKNQNAIMLCRRQYLSYN